MHTSLVSVLQHQFVVFIINDDDLFQKLLAGVCVCEIGEQQQSITTISTKPSQHK
jgi:hypothetical protein